MYLRVVRAVCLSIGLLAAFAPSVRAAGETTPARSISVSGQAVVHVRPDEAIVSVGVLNFDPSLDKAKLDNDAASARLLKAIKALGVEDKHVQTDVMDVDLRYKGDRRQEREIEGYDVRRSYSVRLKDVKLLERLVDAALKNGANQLGGIEYRSTELRKHRDRARELAIRACQEKAVALAGELDCTVSTPRTITEGGGYSGYGRGGNPNFNLQNSVTEPAAEPDRGDDSLPIGQMAISAQISVTFDLVPGVPKKAEPAEPPAK